ncbi:MAG: methionyl-tRNA formyltransferase [Candidatus Cloacimonadia bacterium]
MKRIYNIIFIGSTEFGVPALSRLVSEGSFSVFVITQPDRKKGRGQKVLPTQIKEFALRNNLPVFQPQDINSREAAEVLKKYNPDLILVVSYGKILRKQVLAIPKFGCINLHPSLLPKYRGPAPINWTLFNGEKETGNTIFFMNEKMDAGDIIYQGRRIPILPEDNYGSLYKKLSIQGASDVIKAISLIDEDKAHPIPQDDSQATFSRFITRDLRRINWYDSAQDIANRIRGLAPYPGAFTYLDEKEIKIIEASPTEDDHPEEKPGTIVGLMKNQGVIIATGEKALLVTRIKPAGKKEMSAYNFILGIPDFKTERVRFSSE